MKRVPAHFAHAEGHTDVCFSEDGLKIITCGADGDVRIWEGFDDKDPVQSCIGSWSLCVRHKNDHIYVSTDNHTVQTLSYPTGDRDGLLTRFPAHVNHISVGKKHDYIAMAGEDMQVKVMKLGKDALGYQKTFTDFDGPPLSVEICPRGQLIAVSAGDGSLRIWDIETERLLKRLDCVPKTSSFLNTKTFCRISFEPNAGSSIAYPEKNAVHILSVLSWDKAITLKCPAITEPISIVQYSPCGDFLAAATTDGQIVVWEVDTEKIVGATNGPNISATSSQNPQKIPICSLAWNPMSNGEIAFCDVQGKLGFMYNCNVRVDSITTDEAPSGNVNVDEEDNVISLDKLKKDIMGTDDEDDELKFKTDSKATSRCSSVRPRTPEIPMQASFQPGSTPEHFNPRYLCWNEVGIVKSYGTESVNNDSPSTIEVEFHDALFHNSVMIPNYQSYTMGSLSVSAVMIASATQAAILPLATNCKEWIVALPVDEDIVCISVSKHIVCLVTSAYNVRIYSIFGTQRFVFSLSGPAVAVASHNHDVIVAYHSSLVRNGDQCIGLMYISLKNGSVKSKTLDCPLSPETRLRWLGFTDVGSLVSYDSTGLLRMYPLKSKIWCLSCDTNNDKAHLSDGFFVTAVLESMQVIRGIRCRGAVFPGFLPRPLTSELALRPPFIEIDSEKSVLESTICTWSLLDVNEIDKKYKETVLKLFALASKSNFDQRAYELIELLASPQLLALAAKYAAKMNKTQLAEKLIKLRSSFEEGNHHQMESNFSNQEKIVTSNVSNVVKPLRTTNVFKSGKHPSPKPKLTPKTKSAVNTNSQDLFTTQDANESVPLTDDVPITPSNLTPTIEEAVKNPFLKSLKKQNKNVTNPLSLTDKFAGFNVEMTKENKTTTIKDAASEKRKCPDADTDKQKEKQRKLDMFMFKKSN